MASVEILVYFYSLLSCCVLELASIFKKSLVYDCHILLFIVFKCRSSVFKLWILESSTGLGWRKTL